MLSLFYLWIFLRLTFGSQTILNKLNKLNKFLFALYMEVVQMHQCFLNDGLFGKVCQSIDLTVHRRPFRSAATFDAFDK